MTIRCLFFASLRDKIKLKELQLSFSGCAVKDAVGELQKRFPDAAPHFQRLKVAVNQSYCGEETTLREGDTLAFIPPVSGGG